jgi:hypothetical protein
MTIETELARQLSDAQRSGNRVVDQDAFAAIDRAAAYRVQARTLQGISSSISTAGGCSAAPPARPFGGVLNSLIAYAAGRHLPYPLIAGTIVTTGSLCCLVPVGGTGRAEARMGGHRVEVELI